MKNTFFISILTLALGLTPAMAQYVGPNGGPNNVKQLLEYGRDHVQVTLTGHILSRSDYEDDLYNFNDGTGTMLIKIAHKDWPAGLKVDHNTKVEITGKYDNELIGYKKVKVLGIRAVQ